MYYNHRQWDWNRHTNKPKAGVFIRLGNMERQYNAPTNFWKWSEKAKSKYVLKRFPQATSICDGVPWMLGGHSQVFRNNY